VRLIFPILLAAIPLITGCTPPKPPPHVGEPLGLQMMRTEAQLTKYPFRILQQFESPVDLAFLQCEGPQPQLSPTKSHTGHSSALFDRGTVMAAIKLPSLLSGVKWPGQWTLIGAYFYAEKPQRLRANYEIDGKSILNYTVEVPAQQWTPLLLDISGIEPPTAAKVGLLRVSFPGGLSQQLWCDDVMLLNNTNEIIEPKHGSAWSLVEKGFNYTVLLGNSWITLKTPEATDQGWVLEEANDIRVRFSSKGKEKSRVIYSDGKQFVDGNLVALGIKPSIVLELQSAHDNPARISVPEELGRVNRNTPGDRNNDGYDETSGAYQLIATTSRIEFTLAPHANTLIRPVIEISGLPPGPVTATMAGKWVERIIRLPNNNLLIELPGEFTFPTTVNVKVGQ
jgi:hypothetical protein